MRDPVQLIILGDDTTIESSGAAAEQWIPKDKLFYNSSGVPVRWKGFTAFKLLNLFEKGTDIRPFLNTYKGYNLARVFLYTNPVDWKEKAWDFPNESAALDFLELMKSNGFNVEFCLITDNDSRRLDQVKSLLDFLKAHNPTNLLLEAVNEPFIHDKLNPDLLKNALSGSSFPYTSGIYVYENIYKFYGKYFVDHSPRTGDWFRKGGHSLMDAYNGGDTWPSLRMPCIEDEPIRPDQTSYDLVGAYTYAASCGLMGAGATVHTLSAEFAELPTDGERQWIAAFLQGLNVFPVDTVLSGGYRRIAELGQSDSARTYVIGNYSIRIKQNGVEHPESGWKPLDSSGICWSR